MDAQKHNFKKEGSITATIDVEDQEETLSIKEGVGNACIFKRISNRYN